MSVLLEGGANGVMGTYTGRLIKPLDPDPEQIAIEDIAHALGNSCRYTGHVRKFYSVAQHSVLCSEIVPDELKLTALLHDASEAYLSDISRPIKSQPEFGDIYKKFEERLEAAIAERFDLIYPYPPEIKAADLTLLRTEYRDLMNGELESTDGVYLDFTIKPWDPERAEDIFLRTYKAYV